MHQPGHRFLITSVFTALLIGLCLPAVSAAEDIVIESDEPYGEEFVIESEGEGAEEILFQDDLSIETEDGESPFVEDSGLITDSVVEDDEESTAWRFSIDDVRLEYGHQLNDSSRADRDVYGMLGLSVNWQPQPQWELQLSGRVDGYEQDGSDEWSDLHLDYGDSFVRYRGENMRVTAGTQTVVWGRMDEIPLSDRVSTHDLSRFMLDRLEDRRRANPMLRFETNVAEGKLDLVWLFDFRAPELPDPDSIWYPIDQFGGRILGVDRKDIPPALVRAATIVEDEPDGDGGFGLRYTSSPFFGDIGFTVAHTRRSMPYYRFVAPNTFKTVYPRSWAFGADTAVDAMGATWRAEVVYSSDNPVTHRDFSYSTTEAIEWGVGIEMHPGDGDTRINLQLVGSNLIDPGAIFDRTEAYSLNGEIEIPFDRERWRFSVNFLGGLDEKELYLNPEIAYLGWEPNEIYLALHYFDGDEQTLGGFHEDHSTINLGWRAQF